MAEKRVLTTGEIAKYCGVNFRTVIRWIQRGILRAYKLPGRGDHRVEIYDFINFLKDSKMPIPDEFLSIQKGHVLIVEDDETIAELISTVAKDLGYTPVIAIDGFKAGVLLATKAPQIVTLDLHLPGMGGFEVLRFMRDSTEFKNTRILVISGQSHDSMNLAIQNGAHDFLPKPFGLEALKNKLIAMSHPI